MNIEHAKTILNNEKYVSAYAKWNLSPMQTSSHEFNLAMDWAEAALKVSSDSLTYKSSL